MGKGKKKAPSDSHADTAIQHTAEVPSTKKQHKGADASSAGAAQPPAAAAAAAAAAPPGSSKKRAAKDEIDAIFAAAAAGKKKSAESKGAQQQEEGTQLPAELQQLAQEVGAARQAAQASGKRPKVEGSKDDIFGEATGKARKRTEEGYAVYTEDELGLGSKGGGGDTALCPFDCDCCF